MTNYNSKIYNNVKNLCFYEICFYKTKYNYKDLTIFIKAFAVCFSVFLKFLAFPMGKYHAQNDHSLLFFGI